MEVQVNVSHQLRVLLPDLVNKRMNTYTCNKTSTSLYRKFVVRHMIVITHCIVLKMTYDVRDLYFLIIQTKYDAILFVG